MPEPDPDPDPDPDPEPEPLPPAPPPPPTESLELWKLASIGGGLLAAGGLVGCLFHAGYSHRVRQKLPSIPTAVRCPLAPASGLREEGAGRPADVAS